MIKEISDEKIFYKIFLPNHEKDHLQRMIKFLGKPYELQMLQDIVSRLNSESVFLDVGANIGNHSIYVSLSTQCEVVAFEPDKILCDAINTNIEINNIQNITVENCAIGSENTYCELVRNEDFPESVGAQQVIANVGQIPMKTIDSFNFDKVTCMKIDVEGFEKEVLLGAKETIIKHKPDIYIEAWSLEFIEEILDILSPLGYENKKRFNATPTYLLQHSI